MPMNARNRRTRLMSTIAPMPGPPQWSAADAGDDPLLTAKQAAADIGVSCAAFWRGVSTGRLPAPVYPLPRAPRWFRSELRTALAATRALPCDQKAARRAARYAADLAAPDSLQIGISTVG